MTLKPREKSLIEKLTFLQQEIQKATSVEDCLKGMSISALVRLVPFIEELEKQGFDVAAMVGLARLYEKMTELSIDPERLESFLDEKGSLGLQNLMLRNVNQELVNKNLQLIYRSEELTKRSSLLSDLYNVARAQNTKNNDPMQNLLNPYGTGTRINGDLHGGNEQKLRSAGSLPNLQVNSDVQSRGDLLLFGGAFSS